MAINEENGFAFLSKVAENAGISKEELEETIANKAELVVPTSVFYQTSIEDESISKNMENHVSASVDAHAKSRQKYYIQELKKSADAIIDAEAKKQDEILDSLITANFPEAGIEQDTAMEIIYTNPLNPANGWKKAYGDVKLQIDEELMPLVEQMKREGNQGVAIVRGDDGKGIRVSNNPLWYQRLYASVGGTPTLQNYRDYAYEVLTNPDVAEEFLSINTRGETMEEVEADFLRKKAEIDALFARKQALENIKDKVSTLTSSELGIVKGLSHEGYKVYINVRDNLAQSSNADVRKAGRMSAILFARHADRVAEIMR